MKKATFLAQIVAAVLANSALANATTISQTLGGVDFTNGQTVGAGTFNAASSGQPAPFNAFIGSDISGPNFSGTWTFSYGAIADTITGATLEIGLLDGDSAAPGNQVASYSIGGIDLTSQTGDNGGHPINSHSPPRSHSTLPIVPNLPIPSQYQQSRVSSLAADRRPGSLS